MLITETLQRGKKNYANQVQMKNVFNESAHSKKGHGIGRADELRGQRQIFWRGREEITVSHLST